MFSGGRVLFDLNIVTSGKIFSQMVADDDNHLPKNPCFLMKMK